jgi:hypothetical protein
MTDLPDTRLPPLPPNILQLLAQERDAYPVDLARQQLVYSKVDLAVTLAGAVGASAAPAAAAAATPVVNAAAATTPAAVTGGAVVTAAKAVALKTVATVALSAFVAGAVAGGVVVRTVPPFEAVRPVVVAAPPAPTVAPAAASPAAGVAKDVAPPAPASPEDWVPVPAPPPVIAPLGPPRPAMSSASRRPSTDQLTRQGAVIERARAALVRDNPEGAIAAVQDYLTHYPDGEQVQEIEVIWIQALVKAGRRAEADQRGVEFRKAYPRSVLLPAVDAVLAPPAPAQSASARPVPVAPTMP